MEAKAYGYGRQAAARSGAIECPFSTPVEIKNFWDGVRDIRGVTIDGYKFTRELFHHLTASPPGISFRIIERKDGVITIAQDRSAVETAAPDMLAALREIETICTESAGDCRKRMGTRVGNSLVTARAAIAKAEGR